MLIDRGFSLFKSLKMSQNLMKRQKNLNLTLLSNKMIKK